MKNNNINWQTILLNGFSIWLVATITFRLLGHYFFITDDNLILIVLYVSVIPSLPIVSIMIFRHFHLVGLDCVLGSVLLVLPGMILDTIVIQCFSDLMPNMPVSRASTFGSWLMWAYSIVLLSGILYGQSKRISHSD
ncbi:MAG: DUF5367 domain-containing protein [Leptospira sp.]|nr:DUF5367 domain-containing protein [Leptospira sp.]